VRSDCFTPHVVLRKGERGENGDFVVVVGGGGGKIREKVPKMENGWCRESERESLVYSIVFVHGYLFCFCLRKCTHHPHTDLSDIIYIITVVEERRFNIIC
jgi:hypothetical protein